MKESLKNNERHPNGQPIEDLVVAFLSLAESTQQRWSDRIQAAKAARELGHKLRNDYPNDLWEGRPSIWTSYIHLK